MTLVRIGVIDTARDTAERWTIRCRSGDGSLARTAEVEAEQRKVETRLAVSLRFGVKELR